MGSADRSLVKELLPLGRCGMQTTRGKKGRRRQQKQKKEKKGQNRTKSEELRSSTSRGGILVGAAALFPCALTCPYPSWLVVRAGFPKRF